MIPAEKIPWLATASRRKRWLVGVSGGADSVALLHLLAEGNFRNLIVCHLDHGLRGRASMEDAKFVRRLSAKLGLACESARADVRGRMEMSGESMETAARHSRHAFFANCAARHRCKRILLAHHADDQAETVLWNLLRGSHGLKGMRAEQRMTTETGFELEIHRPLLNVRRVELVAYLATRGHRWREDPSNAEPIAIRNRLRHEALPLLAAISGRDVVLAFSRGAAEAEEIETLESWALEKASLLDPQGRLHLGALRELPPVLQRAGIHRFLRDHGIGSIDRALIGRAITLLDVRNPAVINLPGGGQLRRRAGRLTVGV